MWDAKGAVRYPVAISQLNLTLVRFTDELIMASLAEIMCSVAKVYCLAAAEQALPINMLRTVLFTHGVAGAMSLQLTRPADEVFLSSLFFNTHVCCAVDHTSKVRLLALVTLIE